MVLVVILLEFGSIWTSGLDAVIINLTCANRVQCKCGAFSAHKFTSVMSGGEHNAFQTYQKRVFQSSADILVACYFLFEFLFCSLSMRVCVLSMPAIVDVSFSFVAYLKFQKRNRAQNDDCLNVCLC